MNENFDLNSNLTVLKTKLGWTILLNNVTVIMKIML